MPVDSDHTSLAQICSECGYRVGDPIRPHDRTLFHWRRTVPLIVVVLGIIALTVWLKVSEEESRIDSGLRLPQIIEPAFTDSELQAIAAGEEAEAELAHSILDASDYALAIAELMAGDPRLQVALVEASQTRVVSHEVGWPIPWLTRYDYFNYEDAIKREGFRPAETNADADPLGPYERPRDPLSIPPKPEISWRDLEILYQPAPEETGGVEQITNIHLPGIALALGVVIVAWWIAAFVVFVRNALRRRGQRTSGRRFKLIVVAMAIIAVMCAGLLTTDQTSRIHAGIRSVEGVDTGITPNELQSIAQQSSGDAVLASRILEAVKNQPPPKRGHGLEIIGHTESGGAIYGIAKPKEEQQKYLAATFQAETIWDDATKTKWSEHLPLMYRTQAKYTRLRQFGLREEIALPAGMTVHRWKDWILIRTSPGTASEHTLTWGLSLSRLGMVIVSWALLWMLAMLACQFVHSRIIRKRLAAGRCPVCGYQMQVPAQSEVR